LAADLPRNRRADPHEFRAQLGIGVGVRGARAPAPAGQAGEQRAPVAQPVDLGRHPVGEVPKGGRGPQPVQAAVQIGHRGGAGGEHAVADLRAQSAHASQRRGDPCAVGASAVERGQLAEEAAFRAPQGDFGRPEVAKRGPGDVLATPKRGDLAQGALCSPDQFATAVHDCSPRSTARAALLCPADCRRGPVPGIHRRT
ncbi:conserved hypothetical protein, partial [Ricinus communis]